MSEKDGGRTWHEEEMELARRRKEEWIENRGPVLTWVVEPWGAPLWLETSYAFLVLGIILGVLGTLAFL